MPDIRPATIKQQQLVTEALELLRSAQFKLAAADCPKAVDKIRRARKSAEGAARHIARRVMASAHQGRDPYETAARAAGWDHGGDGAGIIYHKATWGSWKAAVSWAGEDGQPDSPIYDAWRECCEREGIEVRDDG